MTAAQGATVAYNKESLGGSDDAWRDSGERCSTPSLFAVGVVRQRGRIRTPTRRPRRKRRSKPKGDASVRPWKRYAGWPARDGSKFNTLRQSGVAASAKARRASSPVRSPATPTKGAELVADRNRGGSCLACHVMGPPAEPISRAMSVPIFRRLAMLAARTNGCSTTFTTRGFTIRTR